MEIEYMPTVRGSRPDGLLMYPDKIPMGLLSEEGALRNHGQSLSRLKQRGGLGVKEALNIIDSRGSAFSQETQEDVDRLNKIIFDYYIICPSTPTISKKELKKKLLDTLTCMALPTTNKSFNVHLDKENEPIKTMALCADANKKIIDAIMSTLNSCNVI
jgi:hypothetical protein